MPKLNKMEKMNLTLTACELDKSYYDNAIKRINERTNWQSLFKEAVNVFNIHLPSRFWHKCSNGA